MRRAVEHLEQRQNKQRDNAAVFGEGWGMIFRILNVEQQIYSKRIIDETLAQAQLGHLSYASTLSLGNQSYISNPSSTQYTYSLPNSHSSTPTVELPSVSPDSRYERHPTVRVVNIQHEPSSFQQLFASEEYQ